MGKSIVITGAGSGLGRALARCLARDDNTLVLMGRDREKLARVAQELPCAQAIACNVSDPQSVAAAFAAVARTIATLLRLPDDVNLSEMMLEGRFA